MSPAIPSPAIPSASVPHVAFLAQPTTIDGAAATRRTSLVVGAAVLAVTATLSTVAHNSLAHLLGDLAIQLVAVVLGYAVLVPRALARQATQTRTVVLGASAVATVIIFWSGMPLVLGVAAALLGQAGRRGPHARRAVAALVLGLLGVIGYLASYVSDAVAHF